MHKRELPVGGYIPQSFVDYPELISAVVFTSGCNLRCPYCHNPGLVLPSRIAQGKLIPLGHILESIGRNLGLIDGVVVTGGEPTIHDGLPEVLHEFRKLGLRIKLDTNGTNSRMLGRLIGERLVDMVALDIKAPLDPLRYSEVAGIHFTPDMIRDIWRSCELIRSSGIPSVFRSTVVRRLHTPDAVASMARTAEKKLVLQRFRPGDILGRIDEDDFSDEEFRALTRMIG